jgi:outer membrane receptor protein involved in Fe transport
MRLRLLLATALIALLAVGAQAQTTPTGTITGNVRDTSGGVLPGVTVTAISPSLQGTRSATTSANGDYLIPFLPAGDYTVTFEVSGFQKLQKKIRVQVAENIPLNAELSVSAVTEELTVTAETPTDFTQSATVASSYKAEMIDQLPVARDIRGAVLLAPGTYSTGPSGNLVISGAFSFENLFMLNGVVINETLRSQPLNVYIEDAIEETKTSTGNISAEFGRFSGGVVNMITKSGGNEFSGTFRTTFSNDKWTALTPFEQELGEDPRIDKVNPRYEATVGGPVLKDKLWFFGAARIENREQTLTTVYTNIPYDYPTDEQRYEGKLTWSITPKHTFKGAYVYNLIEYPNRSFGEIMDLASIYPRRDPQNLFYLNYTSVLSSNFFVEAQYSKRKFTFEGSGARYTDIERGTMILDRSRGSARWNSPTFCAVCGLSEQDIAAGKLNKESRDNQDFVLKGSYFLSTESTGSHNLVFGFDMYDDIRKNNNYQSGSGYRLYANNTIIRGSGEGTVLYPVVIPGTSNTQSSAAYILWNPLAADSVGSRFRTYSLFLNDTWRFDKKWSFNVGVRYDKNDGKDQTGTTVVKDSAFSPRLSASFDPKGDGSWTVNAGLARYVAAIASGIGDAGSAGGRTASFQYVYRGPAINTDLNTPNPVPAAEALRTVFDWFFANGGTDRPLRSAPSYPGVNRLVADGLVSPSVWEYSLGVTKRLGNKGLVRVDGMYRTWQDFYTEKVDTTTGKVSDPSGRQFDLRLVVNSDDVERTYKGINLQAQYRFLHSLTLGGNYTLSYTDGNFNGEDASSGPVTDTASNFYPEYSDISWRAPIGYVTTDQRHKMRLWASWDAVKGKVGRLNVGLLQSLNSGSPTSSDGTVDSRPYVTNPGYLTPPSTVTYYFGGRGNYVTDTVHSTDLSLNYYLPIGIGKKTELFARLVVDNLFNNAAQDNLGNGTVYTAASQNPEGTMQRFNPFTETPVEGVHYELGPLFGQPVSAADYQTPRSYYFAVGFRF